MSGKSKFKIVYIGLFLIISGIVQMVMKEHNRNVERMIEETERGYDRVGEEGYTRKTQKQSEEITQARRLMYKEPEQALSLIESFLKKPSLAEVDRKVANEMLPNILNNCYYAKSKKGLMDDAKVFFDRMIKEFPEHFQTRSLKRAWASSHNKELRSLIKAGETDAVAKMFEKVAAGKFYQYDGRILAEFQKYCYELYLRNRDMNKAAAEKWLEKASYIWSGSSDLYNLSRKFERDNVISFKELLAMANKYYTEGPRARSQFLFDAVVLRVNGRRSQDPTLKKMDYKQRQAFVKKIKKVNVDSLIELGSKVADGSCKMFTAAKAKDILNAALRQANVAELRIKPYESLIALEMKKFKGLVDQLKKFEIDIITRNGYLTYDQRNFINGIGYKGRNLASSVLDQLGPQLFATLMQDDAFNPWRMVPQEVANEIWKKYPKSGDEKRRRSELRSVVGRERWFLPMDYAIEVEKQIGEIYSRWGLSMLVGNVDEGLKHIRTVLQSRADESVKQKIKLALQQTLQDFSSNKKFDKFFQCAGFYVAEFADMAADDNFRPTFKKCLVDAANSFKGRSQMKYIFVKTLIAGGFAVEAVGINARTEVMAEAFRAVGSVRSEDKSKELVGSSGVNGHGLHIIDNSTEYHLLIFYKGAESFFVHVKPHKKGTVLLKNGNCEMAVITTSEKIIPWKGKVGFQSNILKSVYRVGTDRNKTGYYGSSSWGDYMLLRKPAGIPKVMIDKKSGKVTGVVQSL